LIEALGSRPFWLQAHAGGSTNAAAREMFLELVIKRGKREYAAFNVPI
jgi:hypothetical protein